jgi:hypothetical protein
VAVRVVVAAGRPAEAVQQAADHVGRVGAQLADDRQQVLDGRDRGPERGDARARDRLEPSEHADQIAPARRIDRRAQVADHRTREPGRGLQVQQEVGQERRDRLGQPHGRAQVAHRPAQVDQRGVGLAQRRRQLPQRRLQVLGAASDRVERRVRVRDQDRDAVVARRDRGHDVGGLGDEPLEALLVAQHLLLRQPDLRQRGVQRVDALVQVAAGLGVERPAQLAHRQAQVLLHVRVERVQHLVQVDLAVHALRGDRAAVADLRLVRGAGLKGDVAVGDPGQRGRADRGVGAAVQRLQAVVLDRQLDARSAVVGQRDLRHAADRDAADLHLVALHQLVGVVERHRHPVAAPAAAQQQEAGDHDSKRDRPHRKQA